MISRNYSEKNQLFNIFFRFFTNAPVLSADVMKSSRTVCRRHRQHSMACSAGAILIAGQYIKRDHFPSPQLSWRTYFGRLIGQCRPKQCGLRRQPAGNSLSDEIHARVAGVIEATVPVERFDGR